MQDSPRKFSKRQSLLAYLLLRGRRISRRPVQLVLFHVAFAWALVRVFLNNLIDNSPMCCCRKRSAFVGFVVLTWSLVSGTVLPCSLQECQQRLCLISEELRCRFEGHLVCPKVRCRMSRKGRVGCHQGSHRFCREDSLQHCMQTAQLHVCSTEGSLKIAAEESSDELAVFSVRLEELFSDSFVTEPRPMALSCEVVAFSEEGNQLFGVSARDAAQSHDARQSVQAGGGLVKTRAGISPSYSMPQTTASFWPMQRNVAT